MNNQLLRRAMHNPDDFAIELDYSDSKGNQTHRTVSPIRFVGKDHFLALCLVREEPRRFSLSRCENLKLVHSADILMPSAMGA